MLHFWLKRVVNLKKWCIFALSIAVIAQLVEHQLPKLRVASSSLVYRSSVRQKTNIK